jgi:hypothetical protein
MQSQTAKADVLEQPGTVQFLKLKMGRLVEVAVVMYMSSIASMLLITLVGTPPATDPGSLPTEGMFTNRRCR